MSTMAAHLRTLTSFMSTHMASSGTSRSSRSDVSGKVTFGDRDIRHPGDTAADDDHAAADNHRSVAHSSQRDSSSGDTATADDHRPEAHSSQRDRSPRGASRRSSSSAHS